MNYQNIVFIKTVFTTCCAIYRTAVHNKNMPPTGQNFLGYCHTIHASIYASLAQEEVTLSWLLYNRNCIPHNISDLLSHVHLQYFVLYLLNTFRDLTSPIVDNDPS